MHFSCNVSIWGLRFFAHEACTERQSTGPQMRWENALMYLFFEFAIRRLGGGFKHGLFSPLPAEMIQFD